MTEQTFTAVAEKPRLVYIAQDGSFGYAEGMLLLDTADLEGGPEAYRQALDSGTAGNIYSWAASHLRPGVELVSHEVAESGYVLTTANLADIDIMLSERGFTTRAEMLDEAERLAVASSLEISPPARSGWATIKAWLLNGEAFG